MTLAAEFGNVKFAAKQIRTKLILENMWKHILKGLNITVHCVVSNPSPGRQLESTCLIIIRVKTQPHKDIYTFIQ